MINVDVYYFQHIENSKNQLLLFESMHEVCGEGAYSIIYRLQDNKEVVKINRKKNDLLGIRYPAEYDITSRLNHPHLIKARRITIEGDLVFDYYPYTLRSNEILSLPLEQKELLLKQLFSGLQALHNAGYLHLDIKDDNIFVTEDKSHLVIADFGSALFIGREKGKVTSRELLIDDLKSPELLLAKINKLPMMYRRASDYWSLGLLCLEVLSGEKTIYRTLSLKQLYQQAFCYHRKALELHIKGDLLAKILACLYWDPQEREDKYHQLIGDNFILEKPKELIDLPYRENNRHLFSELAYNCRKTCGKERVEAFFLAIDLFRRLKCRGKRRKRLLLTCFWLALKIVEGCSIDPREIDPDYDKINDLWQTELLILHQLKGCLYPPNFFTSATSRQDLLVAWRYFYSRIGILKEFNFSINECPEKTNLTLSQYLYFLDLPFKSD